MSTTTWTIGNSTSRSGESWGIPVVTLRRKSTRTKGEKGDYNLFRFCGVGVDRVGCVIGALLQDHYQDRLVDLYREVGTVDGDTSHSELNETPGAYAVGNYRGNVMVILNGGMGVSSMQRIAQKIDVKLELTEKTLLVTDLRKED